MQRHYNTKALQEVISETKPSDVDKFIAYVARKLEGKIGVPRIEAFLKKQIEKGIKQREIAETSFGKVVVIYGRDGKYYVLGMSSKGGEKGTWQIPKGKIQIDDEHYFENPSKTAKYELAEEGGLNIEKYKVVGTTDFESFEEKNVYEPSARNNFTREISYKTTNFSGSSVILEKEAEEKFKKGVTITDAESNKERLIKLIPIDEIKEQFNKKQAPTINKVINQLDLKYLKYQTLKNNIVEGLKNTKSKIMNTISGKTPPKIKDVWNKFKKSMKLKAKKFDWSLYN